MCRSFTVETARPEELTPALRMIFQHARVEDQDALVANALELVRQQALDPAGVLVIRGKEGLLGTVVCTMVAGAGSLIWPPQALVHTQQRALEDLLVRRATDWLRQRGAKLTQALLASHEEYLSAPLLRNGFQQITSLWYLRHFLHPRTSPMHAPERLAYQTYAECDAELFHHTLLLTYEDTRDCPEVNGVRTIDEIIAGHQSQGVHDPQRWWLARDAGSPAGVLLLAQMPDWEGWELCYLGVVPQARGRGFGRELTLKALRAAQEARTQQLTVSVDVRNQPAWNLYRSLGFEPHEQRAVFLAIW